MTGIPKHTDDIADNRKAVAPYNFVPLPEEIRYAAPPPPQGFYQRDLLYGTINCSLTNETPIYVRAGQTIEEFEKKQVSSEPFYYRSPEEKLVIPASSLRGMMRTLVEIISFARIGPVSDMQLFYRSVEETSMGIQYRNRMRDKVRAGFYFQDKSGAWIEPTLAGRVMRDDIRSEINITSMYEEFDENDKPIRPSSPKRVPKKNIQHKTVYVKLNNAAQLDVRRFYPVEAFCRHPKGDLEEAVLVITGDMKSRPGTSEKKEFVFLKRTTGEQIELKDEQIELFEHKDQITQYQEHAFPKGNGRPGNGKLKNGDPVFYLVGEDESQIEGFGRAYMFRLPYKKAPADMLPAGSDWDQNAYDLAEAVFGYIPQKKQGRMQLAGRISFTDAVLQGDAKAALLSQTAITLRILSSPKATTFQHYLTQDSPNDQAKLSHYDSPVSKTVLRGHKFYWHKGPVERSVFEADPEHVKDYKTQYSPPVKPIREHQEFKFQIKFEHLRPEELGAILWVLDKAQDEKYRFKLGMGKPYGLGSVAIQSKVSLENRIKRYEKLLSEGQDQWFFSTDPDQENRLEQARQSFAQWLFKKPDSTFAQIDEISQVQELLTLLSWEKHPALYQTRYMELDEFSGKKDVRTGQTGRFTKRPVLPAPHVISGGWFKKPSELSSCKPQESLPREIKRAKPSNEEKWAPVNLRPAELKPGDILMAEVCDAPKSGDVLLHCDFHDDDDFCVIRAKSRNRIDRFVEGENVLLRVVKVLEKKGGWLIECEKCK